MSNLHIEARALGGAHVETTAADMQRLADLLGVCVDLKFNDIAMHAMPGGSADWLVKNWHRAIEQKLPYPSAWSHHEPQSPDHPHGEKDAAAR